MNEIEAWLLDLDDDLKPQRQRRAPIGRRNGQRKRPLAALAGARTPLEAYERGYRQVEAGSLDPDEQHVALLSAARASGSAECLVSHLAMSLRTGFDRETADRLRTGRTLSDPRLEAVRRLSESVVQDEAFLDTAIDPFLEAGFDREQVLDVIVAAKAMQAFCTHLAKRWRGVA